ncbi:MAG: hypothetical protein CMJ24_03245 [Phycisphaerae bacterium]|nr:hypothetical protein [Phycisphaerae bacterium]|tara:strand:- start:45 stop:1211 length:1167 start_codon:yes stop_codon:yes gene_type:complete
MARQLLPVNAPVTFLLLVFLLAPAAVLQGNNILFWMLAILVAAVVMSVLGSRWMIRGLTVRRQLPSHGMVGESLVVEYAVTRRRRSLPCFGLFIDEDATEGDGLDSERARGWVLHVGSGETVHAQAIVVPARRGRLDFEHFWIRTTFPFGMIRRRRRFSQPQHLLVYPRVHALRSRVLESLAPQGPDGLRTLDKKGQGDDYFGIRQLRTGDSIRDIAWKLSAHRDDLVGIERSSPSPPRIRIVLDLSTPTDELQVQADEPTTARELEERAISLAASLATAATSRELEVALTVLGSREPSLPFRGGTWHVHRIMTMLASIDLDEERPAAPVRPLSDLEHAGLIVIRPDRVRPLGSRQDAWYLTARQMNDLVGESDGPSPSNGRSREDAA